MRLLTPLLIFASVIAVVVRPALADGVDDVVRHRMKRDRIPGAVIAIEDEGKVQIRAYGLADLATESPVEKHSVFEFASITKGLTGTAVMKLVEESKLGLDDSITQHLPDAPATWKPITLRHTLTHSHGLPDLLIVLARVRVEGRISGEEQLEHLFKIPASGNPGQKFFYSNTGPFLAGQVIEKVTGTTYDAFLAETVLRPAGMKHVTMINRPEPPKDRVEIYTLRKGVHTKWSLTRQVGAGDDLAWCGTQGTAADLIRYCQAFRSHKLLSARSVELMLDGKLVTASGSIVGHGWFVRNYPAGKAIAHEGHTGTALISFVDRPTSFVVLTNLAKGNQFPFGADKGHSARGFAEEVMKAHLSSE